MMCSKACLLYQASKLEYFCYLATSQGALAYEKVTISTLFGIGPWEAERQGKEVSARGHGLGRRCGR